MFWIKNITLKKSHNNWYNSKVIDKINKEDAAIFTENAPAAANTKKEN